ncbi:MAG: restriction endonuclease subunit S [Chloroflexi bacterium]|nr:restriction endonuclease subunit S [Chloroflexota bacterium]
MSWRRLTIGDLVNAEAADIQTGPFGTQLKASNYVAEGTPVINVRNIGFGQLKPNKLEFVAEETVDRLVSHLLEPNDIVFGRKGAVERHLYVNSEQQHWMQGSDCIRLRFMTDEVVPRFVSYAFLTDAHQKWMLTQAGNKATMASLNHDIIKRIDLRLPSRGVQDSIVDILSAYDDLIENNRRRMGLLEDAARQLYREWFVRLRFPGHEHTRIVDGVPEGWERVKLGELAEITMGQSPESKHYNEDSEGFPFHQGVTDFGDRFVTHRIYSTAMNRIAGPGDILCSVRAPVGRLNVTLDKIVIGRGLAALRSKTGHQSLLLQQLRAHFFKEDLIGGGAIFASVTKKEFSAQGLLEPPERLKRAFEDVTVPCDEQIRVLHLQNQKLRAARDLLLPRLMSGEVTA